MEKRNIIEEIQNIIAQEEPILRSLSEDVITSRFNHQNRSIKMLIGHLIDSASNNHQRMVRLQYAPRCGHSMPNTEMGMLVFPDYTQDNDLWLQLQFLGSGSSDEGAEVRDSTLTPLNIKSI